MAAPFTNLTTRLADRLRELRRERGWSLDDLASRSGISRATLSRMEKADVSPTAEQLGKLCAAHAMPASRLLALAEERFPPVVARADQAIWTDEATGFCRRSVSPPAAALAAEVIEGTLKVGGKVAYDAPPVPGLEHHLVVLSGRLRVTVEGTAHELSPGDCLRYLLFGSTRFEAIADARYLLVLV